MPAFDTLKATKLLKESGFDETQAEAVVSTVRDAVAENVATKADLAEVCNELKLDHAKLRTELKEDIANVRTEIADVRAELKEDIHNLRTELKEDIAGVRAELKEDIHKLRTDMYRFGAFMIIAIVSLIVTLMKLLP